MTQHTPWHGPYFVVFATDKPDMSALRERMRPTHRAWLRAPGKHQVVVRFGGPTLDAQGTMNGTMLVVQANDVAAVEAFVKEDPYVRNGLFERFEIRPWKWGLGQPEEGHIGTGFGASLTASSREFS